ncbi:MAG: hypothetical protein DBY32_09115 [Phascolarctobacterium sp.]|nr:MAG: hypothetical protein DBY32_09115 [Phascolarctobacterium sp.]
MNKTGKFLAAAAIMGTVIGAGIATTQAAIPVIDSQNIAQQLKTYTETAKLVSQTAEQITLQAKELASLPTSVLRQYTNGINNSIRSINNTLNSTIVFSENATENTIRQYWENKFPVLNNSDDWIISERNHLAIITNLQEEQSEDNKQSLVAYQKLMQELDDNQAMLDDLLEQNENIEGNKQGQQISNQIAGVTANIKRIELALRALDHKQKIEADQAAITVRQNDMILAQKRAEAEEAAISALDTTSKTAALDDPWSRYGASTVNW